MRYATVSQSSVTANGPCAHQGRAQRRQACMPPFVQAGAGGWTVRTWAAPAGGVLAAAGSVPQFGCHVYVCNWQGVSAFLIHHTLKKGDLEV